MKRYFWLYLSLLAFSITAPKAVYSQDVTEIQVQSNTIATQLEAVAGVTECNKLENSGPFEAKFEVMFRQPLDHNNPEAGTFEQRFYVLHRGADKPVVFVTEGYRGVYAANPRFTNEIAERYDANIIVAEHRYFQRSTPEPRNWDYLTVENSMVDLHRIREAMAGIYPEKWIATGISKGGQTTIMYAAYFPGDVDIYIPYVAPVCFGVEDGRHEPFIANVCGTPDDRAKILSFQREVLERRDEIQPLFEQFCNEKEMKFRIPIEEVYDYCVLEYSFAFWQWGTPTDEIPTPDSDAQTVFKHFEKVAGPDYFSISAEPSFNVQAARELGYYGYDTRPFEGLLKITSADGYLHRIFLPEDALHYEFSDEVYRNI